MWKSIYSTELRTIIPNSPELVKLLMTSIQSSAVKSSDCCATVSLSMSIPKLATYSESKLLSVSIHAAIKSGSSFCAKAITSNAKDVFGRY